jgi:uncharacterized membrane protein YvlD (DUF360 family)
MSKDKLRPTRWYYILAVLIPVFACVGTVLLVYQNVPKLPGALESTGIKNLTQVVVPGSAEIYFPKAGAYAVYYEYRSVINGASYVRAKYPPSINCQLTSKATGEDIDIAPDYVEGNVYATQNDERVGVLIKSITLDQPGAYTFSCQYTDGRTDPEIVLAVGPNIIYEFFNIAVKPIAAGLIGVPIFIIACGLSIVIVGVVAFKRHRSDVEETAIRTPDGQMDS